MEAVGRLGEIDRVAVRRRFEERFTARRMAEDYLDIYKSLAAVAQPRRLALVR